MMQNPNKILIIVYQLNTAKFENLFANLTAVGYYQNALAAYFIFNILQGEIFIGSKKVFASRLYQYEKLHLDYKLKFLAYVVGLTKDICHNKDLYSYSWVQLILKKYFLESNILHLKQENQQEMSKIL